MFVIFQEFDLLLFHLYGHVVTLSVGESFNIYCYDRSHFIGFPRRSFFHQLLIETAFILSLLIE